jgi:hypothetical protein
MDESLLAVTNPPAPKASTYTHDMTLIFVPLPLMMISHKRITGKMCPIILELGKHLHALLPSYFPFSGGYLALASLCTHNRHFHDLARIYVVCK